MDLLRSIFKEVFPGRPQWSTDQIPDLSGQVMIVTGGNTGIGKETCKALLNKGAKVYLAARNKDKAKTAIEWLRNETDGKLAIFLQLDLSDLDSIRRAAAEFREKEQELHVLFNNAGVMGAPLDMKTSSGYDLQFGTNALGHYLFTMLLLPVLIHTAQTSEVANGHARVINTASGGHWFAPTGGINYTSIEPNSAAADEARKKMGSFQLYTQSKWGNIAFSNELHRRYRDKGIVSISLHPGAIESEIQRHFTTSLPMFTRIAEYLLDLTFRWPTPCGALTQLYAGTTAEGLEHSGGYLIPWGRICQTRPDTLDVQARERLWTWFEEQVKIN